jgi:hypothetical protein
MKQPHPQGLETEHSQVSWANTVHHATGSRYRFQSPMELTRPCLDVGRYLMLMRQHHAKRRQKPFGAPALLAHHSRRFASK